MLPKGVSIRVVPSCIEGNFDTGLARLGKRLADNGRVDDVATTGNSMTACRDILMRCGAREVKMIVLGMTSSAERRLAERACAG